MKSKVSILTLLVLALTTVLSAVSLIENQANLPILTPAFQDQKIRKIKLDNNLEAILISDPRSDKSGAVLSIEVGSWEDPKEHPGMAHFLEHMLFMGTTKYPQEEEYQKYIKDHGGQMNAFTANHITSFMFSIDPSAFQGAIDRFSEFFKEPLFNPSGVSRELQAIDQEYAKNVENDDLRGLYILKSLAKPEHPHHRFNMGNSATLKDVSRDSLKKWYEEHYSANLMRLLVISTQSLDELQAMVEKDFSTIRNLGRERFILREPYTDTKTLGSLITITPINNIRTLSIVWELPTEFAEMKLFQPEALISYVLGHEGEESLLAQLKRENLAEKLACGIQVNGTKNRELYIEIGLTDQGLHEYQTVIKRVFQAIHNFKENGVPRYLFDEIKQIQTLEYQFQEREEVFEALVTHGLSITEENIASYPLQTKIVQEYNPKAILSLLDYMTPQHAVYILKVPQEATNTVPNRQEQWLQAHFSVESLAPALLEEWAKASPHPNIKLPEANPFIPQNFELVRQEAEKDADQQRLVPLPQKIVEDAFGTYYYAQDRQFQIPKIFWSFYLRTPEIKFGDALKVVLADLYIKALENTLSKYSYPAQMGGLEYNITREINGIKLTLFGYSDKAELLLSKILETMGSGEIDFNTFNTYKETLLRKYENANKASPLTQDAEVLKKAIYKNFTTDSEKAAAIKKVSLQKFRHFVKGLFNQTYVEGILYGNMTGEKAGQVASQVQKTFHTTAYPKKEQLKKEVILLPDNGDPMYLETTSTVSGNAAILAIEYVPYTFEARGAQEILSQGMSEPFFSELRTRQQTGYIVFNNAEEIEKHLFSFFAVQSNTHNPRDLLARFELFIENFMQELTQETLTEERFKKLKNALIQELKVPAKNLKEMGTLLETLAFQYESDFEWIHKRLEGVETLTYDAFVKTAQAILGKSNHRRLGALLKGVTADNSTLNYSKLRTIRDLKKVGSYPDEMTMIPRQEAIADK